MTRLYANNAATTLNGSITNVATSCTLTSATNFPTISGGDYYVMTIDDGTNTEIIKVTASSGTSITTMVRAQEGTTAVAFASGSTVEIRDTAAAFSDAGINITDITTNNVSTTAHGFAPKLSGDSAQYLNGVGAWATVSGGGDVVGPASAVNNSIVLFDSTTGKLIKNMAAAPGADRLLFWDHSATSTAYLTLGTNLSITGTTLDATGGGTPGGSTTQVQYNNAGAFAGESGFVRNGAGDYTVSTTFNAGSIRLNGSTVSVTATNVDLTIQGNTTAQRIICNSLSAIQIPTGTTAQRPGSAGTGNLRVNTSTLNPEIGISNVWYTVLSDVNFGSAGVLQCTAANTYSVLTSVPVTLGGTGRTTSTIAYGVICAGTTATGAHQTIASVGTAGQKLTSNGPGALPTMQGAPGFVSVNRATAQAIAASTYTKLQLNVEVADVDSAFDNATNYRHTPTKAGRWLYISCVSISGIATTEYLINAIYKNGTNIAETVVTGIASPWVQNAQILDMNGTTDYVEVFLYHNNAASKNTQTTDKVNYLLAILL